MGETLDSDARRRIRENRENWDARAPVHAESDFYSLRDRPAAARFHPREWEDFGPLEGRSVLHLQCHNGVETLAFAQRGAARVTGLDFSGASLDVARRNAEAAGAAVEFVEADVYDAGAALGGRTFDLVYTSRGSLMFLPDLRAWAEVVTGLVAPGGLAYVMEFHPVLNSLGRPGVRRLDDPLVLRHDYLSGGRPTTFDSRRTYAPSRRGALVEGATVSHEWAHTVVDVIVALGGAGLDVDVDRTWETDWDVLPRWEGMTEVAPGWWRRPDDQLRVPLLYATAARRRAGA
ncbi:class I SAM-dependent methyltransferase [Streptomyces sp. NPDC127098]|uniref:class I SAM-dependent methyltransferase n=1 Tax=Streptomyces sp. NPDC127098 TaxID=3347137 RepID=UPI003652D977